MSVQIKKKKKKYQPGKILLALNLRFMAADPYQLQCSVKIVTFDL